MSSSSAGGNRRSSSGRSQFVAAVAAATSPDNRPPSYGQPHHGQGQSSHGPGHSSSPPSSSSASRAGVGINIRGISSSNRPDDARVGSAGGGSTRPDGASILGTGVNRSDDGAGPSSIPIRQERSDDRHDDSFDSHDRRPLRRHPHSPDSGTAYPRRSVDRAPGPPAFEPSSWRPSASARTSSSPEVDVKDRRSGYMTDTYPPESSRDYRRGGRPRDYDEGPPPAHRTSPRQHLANLPPRPAMSAPRGGQTSQQDAFASSRRRPSFSDSRAPSHHHSADPYPPSSSSSTRRPSPSDPRDREKKRRREKERDWERERERERDRDRAYDRDRDRDWDRDRGRDAGHGHRDKRHRDPPSHHHRPSDRDSARRERRRTEEEDTDGDPYRRRNLDRDGYRGRAHGDDGDGGDAEDTASPPRKLRRLPHASAAAEPEAGEDGLNGRAGDVSTKDSGGASGQPGQSSGEDKQSSNGDAGAARSQAQPPSEYANPDVDMKDATDGDKGDEQMPPPALNGASAPSHTSSPPRVSVQTRPPSSSHKASLSSAPYSPQAPQSPVTSLAPPPPAKASSPLAPPPDDPPPPPPPLEELPARPSPPPLSPTTGPALSSAERRKAIRAQLKPLKDRVFVGCSDPSAYQKVDDSQGGLLGMGTFGEVSRAKHVKSSQEVALKKIKIQANESQSGMPITAIREIKLLKTLSHPNVCPAVDMVYEPPPISAPLMSSGTFYMVLPYMEHDLNGLIERLSVEDKPFSPAQIKLYMKQLFEGTLYLHKNKILHRDIKAANILISNNGNLKIADFGLARPYHDPGDSKGHPAWRMDERGQSGWHGGEINYTGMVVTRWYRPPELLAGERKYGPAVDMWGLGCLLAEMIVRRPMFKGSSEINQLEQIAELCGSPCEETYPGWSVLPGVRNLDNSGQTKVDKNEKGRHDFGKKPRWVRERFMGMVRSELAELIDRLLVLDPRKRLTAEGALAHKWFDVEPLPADPACLPQYPDSKEANKAQHREQAAGQVVSNKPMPPTGGPGMGPQQQQQQQQHVPTGPSRPPMPMQQYQYYGQQQQPQYTGPPPSHPPMGPMRMGHPHPHHNTPNGMRMGGGGGGGGMGMGMGINPMPGGAAWNPRGPQSMQRPPPPPSMNGGGHAHGQQYGSRYAGGGGGMRR